MINSNIGIWPENFAEKGIFNNELIDKIKNLWFKSSVEDILAWNYWAIDAVMIWEKLPWEVILGLIKINKQFKSSNLKCIFLNRD